MDANGALNLVSSPSSTEYNQADTSSLPLHLLSSSSSPRRSPNSQGGRAGQSFGVEMCVVCGDRASGKIFIFIFLINNNNRKIQKCVNESFLNRNMFFYRMQLLRRMMWYKMIKFQFTVLSKFSRVFQCHFKRNQNHLTFDKSNLRSC